MREDNMMPTLTCTTFRKHLLTELHCRFRHAAGLNDREKNLKVAESQTPADMIFRRDLRHSGFR
jgi:hypothetical protein